MFVVHWASRIRGLFSAPGQHGWYSYNKRPPYRSYRYTRNYLKYNLRLPELGT